MNQINDLRFILHVSDFHLTDDKKELNYATSALKSLAHKLNEENIKIEYLIHTGDIINSSDIYEKVATHLSCCHTYFTQTTIGGKTVMQFNTDKFIEEASENDKKIFDNAVKQIVDNRFLEAEKVMQEFISNLNVPFGNVVICSGNHDVIRPLSYTEKPICTIDENNNWNYNGPLVHINTFNSFENFLNNLGVANCKNRCNQIEPVTHCTLGNLNALIINTNWQNPSDQKTGYYCIRCEKIRQAIKTLSDTDTDEDTLNIILSHKPFYEICEKIRLAYKRYIKTPFMSDIHKFLGNNGIYLCGDKHTRSIVGSYFHDIPHYIAGEPLCIINRNHSLKFEVEYNLLEIAKNKLGMERKIHLTNYKDYMWNCDIRPQDTVVSKIYEFSKDFINNNTFRIIDNTQRFNSWENICQEIYNWDSDELTFWHTNLNQLFQSVCKYRKNGTIDISLKNKNIFSYVIERMKEQISVSESKNILNIRGEYSSGKSTFLGLLYIYLLYYYSVGKIDFIPAYFNLENSEILEKIKSGESYFNAVKYTFLDFTNNIVKISGKEHQSICYIIDGLDEQDCWSLSTEDSVGRGLLDVLAQHNNSWYIMSFSQNRLPHFKNTMPARKYNDSSDIMYFNPIDVQENTSEDLRFKSFVRAFLNLSHFSQHIINSNSEKSTNISNINIQTVEDVCTIIRNFRRLTINPGFMYQNFNYLTNLNFDRSELKNKNSTVRDIYKYYIDRQEEICLQKLGYNFVRYAPIMSYLFTYKGFTYEKFKSIHSNKNTNSKNTYKKIANNFDKIYDAFLFIKKHKDAREYLIALHYNYELRYYAENPHLEIEEDSILNEFITRNISVLIRKLWSDPNKFVIACSQLLKRENLSNCMQSMLIYCLAHQPIYTPIRDQILEQLRQKSEATLSAQFTDQRTEKNQWRINGSNHSQALRQFINLSLKHSLEIFSLVDKEDSINLVNSIIPDRAFQKYNRQYQMLYYGDLSIQGEDKKNPLTPGKDIIYKGFDFHNCFNYLYVKLISNYQYPLREFDIFTMIDIIYSRISVKHLDNHINNSDIPNTFFYREAFSERATIVLEQAKNVLNNYITANTQKNDTAAYKYFEFSFNFITRTLEARKNQNLPSKINELVQSFNESIENIENH